VEYLRCQYLVFHDEIRNSLFQTSAFLIFNVFFYYCFI
jgi:hypothetical protein